VGKYSLLNKECVRIGPRILRPQLRIVCHVFNDPVSVVLLSRESLELSAPALHETFEDKYAVTLDAFHRLNHKPPGTDRAQSGL